MRGILFDFGGTLDYPRHWLDRFVAHYHGAGINLTRAQLDPGFDYATRTAYRASAEIRRFNLAELIDYLVRLQIAYLRREGAPQVRDAIDAAAGGRRLDECVGWLTQSFVAESMRGYGASRELLEALAPRFRLGVVSNFYGNLDLILQEAGLAYFFHAIVDSSRVGIFKPQARIFDLALTQLGIGADRVAMVGDSLDKDCAPARRLGITSIWLKYRDGRGYSEEAEGAKSGGTDFTIGELAELKDLRWWKD